MLLGYNYSSPIDPTDHTIIDNWLDLGMSDATPDRWLDVNEDENAWNACVIYTDDSDRAYSFWKVTKILGIPVAYDKITTYKSQGWALP
mgnify:CR=1 FL=1